MAPDSVHPPEPVLPLPTARQLAWQRLEMNMFIHFGMNTFTGWEWGTGKESSTRFRPTQFAPRQWARVAEPVTARRVRAVIEAARANPLLSERGLYYDSRKD